MRAPPKKTVAAKKKAPSKLKRQLDPTPAFFGQRVKAVRELRGLSQSELGSMAGIPQPDMPAIERGDRDVRLSTANRLAHALGVLLCELLPTKP